MVTFYFLKILCSIQKQPSEVLCKKKCSKKFANFTGKHLCWSLFLIKLQTLRPATLLKAVLTQVLSCEIYKIFNKTYFEEHPRTTASLHFILILPPLHFRNFSKTIAISITLSSVFMPYKIQALLLLMIYQIFLSPQVKRCAIITYKHGIWELPHELPNDLRLWILGN